MKSARLLGNHIEHLAAQQDISISAIGSMLGCDEHGVQMLLKGRAVASFPQISKLARCLNTSVSELLAGDLGWYDNTVVHCMNSFKDTDNREMILDLIDNYIDLVDVLSIDE